MDEHLRAAHRLMWHDEIEGGYLRPEVIQPCKSNRASRRILLCIGLCLGILAVVLSVHMFKHYQKVHVMDLDLESRRLQQIIEENDRMIQFGNHTIKGLDEQIHRARSKVQRRWDLYKDKTYKPSVIWANDDVTVERWDQCR